MSFSVPGGGAGGGGGAPALHEAAAPHPDLGARLGQYMESRFPVASGLAQSVFGGGTNAPAAVAAPQLPGPIMSSGPQMAPQPDYSNMISANAKPKEGSGGLGMLLKLIGV